MDRQKNWSSKDIKGKNRDKPDIMDTTDTRLGCLWIKDKGKGWLFS